jgi:probable DNA repair protein
VDAHRAGPANEDVGAWLEWSARYERSTRGNTDAARLPDVVAQGLDLGTVKPAVVALAGFDIMTPQLRDFLAALAAAGTKLLRVEDPAHEAQPVRVELTQRKDEIAAAARWARARLERNPDCRIGIVVPDLARARARVHRMFAEVMAPGHALDASATLPFDVSLGAPLATFPIVGDALAILALAGPRVAFALASRVVRSPFIGGADSERDVRARFDARLRERSGPEISLGQLTRLDCLAAFAEARKAGLTGSKTPSQWAKAFSEALRAAGFPGERTLDSAEHQALERWHALLADFGSLERVTGKIKFADAHSKLARLATEAIFQPESPEVPVRILGVLESAGQEFDHLWVVGLTDDAWPLPARPNPFLPVRAQRAAGIPQADPAASLELDRRITEGWKRAAREVVFSHARAEGDSELTPSPLIAGVPAASLDSLGLAAPPTLRAAIRRAAQVDAIEDARAPAIVDAIHRGGTGLFRDQAACPFRGFAHRRVASKPLEVPRPGLDPRDRGNLLHEMLAAVWTALDSRAALAATSREARHALLEKAADAAIANVKRKRGEALSGRFEALERERLVRLVDEWLDVEAARPDFQVLATESLHPLTFGGVTVQARLDRMDAVAKGRAIIDYKTGACATSSWLGERPDEPQLPMYALSGIDVSVVAFGQVKAGEMGFKGFAREEGLVPDTKDITDDRSRHKGQYRDWSHLLERWREELEAIGHGFASGDARVDPKRGPLTCQTCDQHAFCRIAEKGTFGVRKGEPDE